MTATGDLRVRADAAPPPSVLPAFVDHARRAIESACADATFTRANP